jgi:hypothetical protein
VLGDPINNSFSCTGCRYPQFECKNWKVSGKFEIFFSLFFPIRECLQVFGKVLVGRGIQSMSNSFGNFEFLSFGRSGGEMSLGSILSAPLDGVIFFSIEEFASPMRKLKFCCTLLAVSLSDRPLSIGLWGRCSCWILSD